MEECELFGSLEVATKADRFRGGGGGIHSLVFNIWYIIIACRYV